MSRNILITGGAGFIGSNFAIYLLNKYQDITITILDKLTYAGNLENLNSICQDSRYTFVKGDISDKKFITSFLNNNNFNQIAHFAAESHVDRSILGPEEFIHTNIMGTYNVIETLRTSDWAMQHEDARFLHVSTDEVFGSLGKEGYFTEETAYSPNSPYSASKASSDHLVYSYFKTFGLPVLLSNCSNNYGPYQFPEKLIPLIVLNCLNGKALPVYGDGCNVRDWLYVEDHCEALDLILKKAEIGSRYNIGGHNEWKNIDIVKLICTIMDKKHDSGKAHEKLITFVKDRAGHDQRYAIDASKIERDLGWQPKFTFENAIEQTIDWYLNNSKWVANVVSGEYKKYYSTQYGA